jgi:hypothetical protein
MVRMLVGAVLVGAVLPLAGPPEPAFEGVWSGTWKATVLEGDGEWKLTGRLTLVHRGQKVCASWTWNRFADGRPGKGTGSLRRQGLSVRGADGFGSVTWTARMSPEAETFFGTYRDVGRSTGEVRAGSIHGVRLGPARASLRC